MPPLNEGDLMFMPVTDPAISLPQAIEIVKKQNAAIQAVPEVASVVAKIARAETSTDPAPREHDRDHGAPQAGVRSGGPG